MRAQLLACVIVLGCAGESGAAPKQAKRKAEKPVSTEALKWSLAKSADGKTLSVSFEVRNVTAEKLYVADRLVRALGNRTFRREDRIVVMTGDDPETVRFVVGAVSADEPSVMVYEPTYVAVEPGATHRRTIAVPLPLETYNPVGGTSPLSPKAARAVLFVHVIPGEPAKWVTHQAEDGSTFRVPEPRGRKVLQSEPLSLPQ